jgi:hypothetical protein
MGLGSGFGCFRIVDAWLIKDTRSGGFESDAGSEGTLEVHPAMGR